MANPLWLVCAARFELPPSLDIPLFPLGVGLLPATCQLAKLLEHQPTPRAIVLAGTAGVWQLENPKHSLPYGPFLCHQFLYPPYCFEEIPQAITKSRYTGGFPALDALVDNQVQVYSTFGITQDPSVMAFPPNRQTIFLENLEALGLAELCYQRNIPFYALLAVTNYVGPQAREEWRQHYQAAGELLATSLQQLLAYL